MSFFKRDRAYFFIKRALDIFFSVLLLFFLSIPMSLVALLIVSTSKGGAIFKQHRIGKDGNIFTCYKFRTMYEWTPSDRPKSSFTDSRKYITPVGGFLRKTSLDELPQLFNVIMGDMSLVGPRPLIAEEGEIHRLRQRCGVYGIRPGITGLAQINGRDNISDMDKARFDARYVRELSIGNDVKIILKTVLGAMPGN